MHNLLVKWLPNLLDYKDEFWVSIIETLQMLVIAGVFAFIFGLFFGVILVVTKEGNINKQKTVNTVIDKVINVFRSIPFIILLSLLLPLTRIVMGTAIGLKGAIFPIVIGSIPFFVRQVDMALSDLDEGLIEAAQAMGASRVEIIFKVYLRESIPALVRSTTIMLISLIGMIAMGGAVGAGGLGTFVIRYGYNRFMFDITLVSVVVILIIVSVIQGIGDYIIKRTTH